LSTDSSAKRVTMRSEKHSTKWRASWDSRIREAHRYPSSLRQPVQKDMNLLHSEHYRAP